MNANKIIKYLGITGLPGSGKGEFVRVLHDLFTEQEVGLRYYSLSDELRDEARQRSLPIERPVLRSMANDMRLKYGGGILADKLVKKISRTLTSEPPTVPTVIVIDAIRTPDEVSTLKTNLGEEFLLIALEAPIETLIERISSRARFDERTDVIEREDVTRKMILGEAGQDEPSFGHNIKACIAMADHKINNSQTLAHLTAQVVKVVESIMRTNE